MIFKIGYHILKIGLCVERRIHMRGQAASRMNPRRSLPAQRIVSAVEKTQFLNCFDYKIQGLLKGRRGQDEAQSAAPFKKHKDKVQQKLLLFSRIYSKIC